MESNKDTKSLMDATMVGSKKYTEYIEGSHDFSLWDWRKENEAYKTLL